MGCDRASSNRVEDEQDSAHTGIETDLAQVDQRTAELIGRFNVDTTRFINPTYSIEIKADSTPVLFRNLALLDISSDGSSPYILAAEMETSRPIKIFRLRVAKELADSLIADTALRRLRGVTVVASIHDLRMANLRLSAETIGEGEDSWSEVVISPTRAFFADGQLLGYVGVVPHHRSLFDFPPPTPPN